MQIAAGLVIICENKILLCHPTNSKWYGTYSIPKGLVNEGEDHLTCAIRETKEEIGVKILEKNIQNKDNPFIINYLDKKGKVYKQIYCYIVNIYPEADEIGERYILKENLQLDEIDWAGFVDKEEAKKRIFPKQSSVLTLLCEVL